MAVSTFNDLVIWDKALPENDEVLNSSAHLDFLRREKTVALNWQLSMTCAKDHHTKVGLDRDAKAFMP